MAVVPLEHRFDGPSSGPLVLMLPALGAKWSMWEPQMPELTRHMRVLRVNHRGHGASPAPPGEYTVGELADDVLALLDARGVERAAVVGACLGGMIALHLARLAPDRVERLVLLSTTARATPAGRWGELAAQARTSGARIAAPDITRCWFTPAFAEQRPDVVARMSEEAARVDTAGFAGGCAAVSGADHRKALAGLRVPTMVVSAAHDPVAPPAHGRRVAALIPRACFEVVRGAAHLLNIERADRINEVLVEHLAR